jgi:STE24 endopeptidase
MNLYGIIILSVLLADFCVHFIADYLNLRTLSSPLPKEFNGTFDTLSYQSSQIYTRTRTIFGVIESTFSIITILLFWFADGFNFVDVLLRSLGFSAILNGIFYVGVLVLLRSILSLPFSIYSTFVIEERFGFNKTTPRTFVTDILKGILLGILIGAPLLASVLAFFTYAGSFAWIYCWIAASVFILLLQFIAPTWIMPIFNKFTSLPDGELRQAIFAYAGSVNYTLKDIYIMDGSKRSSKSNAFFTGFGKNKRIALFDTLIAKHTVTELVAVLAHEIGHYKKKHIAQGIVLSIMQMGVMFYLLSFFIGEQGLHDAFYMNHVSVYTGMIFFGLLYTPIEFILGLAGNVLSRQNEFTADRFAAETTRQPEVLINALKKLSLDNLSHLTPHPFYVFLHYSHPTVLERIETLRTLK